MRLPIRRIALAWWLISGLSGCRLAVLEPAGPIAAGNRIILLDSLAIMLAIVAPTIVAILVVSFWFRAGNARARFQPRFAYSGRIELIVWSIPALVVFFLGGVAWIGAHRLDPAQPIDGSGRPLQIEVIALDWKWLFIYPEENLASVNRIVVPTGVPLQLRLTSASVLNVFFVPELGSQIYAMYGMTTRLNLRADHSGAYFGLAAHFNGNGFPDMAFEVQAVPTAQFSQWVAQTREAGPVLDQAAYRELSKQTARVAPGTYRDVQRGLFEAVVQQQLPPGPGPTQAVH